jgi:hypothetical protein
MVAINFIVNEVFGFGVVFILITLHFYIISNNQNHKQFFELTNWSLCYLLP